MLCTTITILLLEERLIMSLGSFIYFLGSNSRRCFHSQHLYSFFAFRSVSKRIQFVNAVEEIVELTHGLVGAQAMIGVGQGNNENNKELFVSSQHVHPPAEKQPKAPYIFKSITELL